MVWNTAPLLSLCKAYQPKTIGRKEMDPNAAYPVYGANGIIGRYHKANHEEPELVIGCRGSCGAVNVTEGEAWITGNAMVLKPNSDCLDRNFLRHFLADPSVLSDVITGVAQPQITRKSLATVQVPVPPLKEQRRIVAILDEAFAGIANAAAIAEKNLANAWELQKASIDIVFSDQESWNSRDIGEFGEVFDGPHATPKTGDAGPIFLGISALEDGEIKLEKTRHVTEEDYKKWTKRVTPREDDIVFSYETRLGQAAIIPRGLTCCLGRRMGLIRVKQGADLLPEFVLQSYLSSRFQKVLKENTVAGATVDRISLKQFPSFKMGVPDLSDQRSIVERCRVIRMKVDALVKCQQAKMQALAGLRQSFLKLAFSGELINVEQAAAL